MTSVASHKQPHCMLTADNSCDEKPQKASVRACCDVGRKAPPPACSSTNHSRISHVVGYNSISLNRTCLMTRNLSMSQQELTYNKISAAACNAAAGHLFLSWLLNDLPSVTHSALDFQYSPALSLLKCNKSLYLQKYASPLLLSLLQTTVDMPPATLDYTLTCGQQHITSVM
jgi:hypothetical protein